MKFTPLKFLGSLIAVALAISVCVCCIDIPLANLVRDFSARHRYWARTTAVIPDVLLILVCVIAPTAFAWYEFRLKRGIVNEGTWCLRLVGVALPLAYLLKFPLKLVFGRVNTRTWLTRPELYGFHWLQGGSGMDGFPSGHLAVFGTLLAAVWRYYPRSKPVCLLCLILLAAALIATNYHFLGDVIGGAYVGLCVEAAASSCLNRYGRTGI